MVTIGKEARELISMGHHASQTINERNATLQSLWRELKNLASGRKRKLGDALEAQKVMILLVSRLFTLVKITLKTDSSVVNMFIY